MQQNRLMHFSCICMQKKAHAYSDVKRQLIEVARSHATVTDASSVGHSFCTAIAAHVTL